MESLPQQGVIVATGSRRADRRWYAGIGEHPRNPLREGDSIILSAMPIPARAAVQPYGRQLFRQGVDVLYHELGDVHVSGRQGLRHARTGQAKYFIRSGEYAT